VTYSGVVIAGRRHRGLWRAILFYNKVTLKNKNKKTAIGVSKERIATGVGRRGVVDKIKAERNNNKKKCIIIIITM